MYKAIGAAIVALYLAITLPPRFMATQEKQPPAGRLSSFEATPRTDAGTAVGYRDRSGQFSFNAMLNGSHEKVLVDTGASSVAINRTTARRIGISVEEKDFRFIANTANGQAKFARGTIRELHIDGVRLRNVEAAILPDKALSGTLLGMTFLNRLKRYEFDGNRLTLVQ